MAFWSVTQAQADSRRRFANTFRLASESGWFMVAEYALK